MCHKLLQKLCRTGDKLDLGKQLQKEVCVIHNVVCNDVSPPLDRGAEHILYRAVECANESLLLVVALPLTKWREISDTGVGIVLEGKAENLVKHLARLKMLGVDRDNAGRLGSELSVKVNSYGNALDLVYSVRECNELLVELAVIFGLGELVHKVCKSAERRALDLVFYISKAASQSSKAGDVKLYLGDTVKVRVSRGYVVVIESA